MDISLYFNPVDFDRLEESGKFHRNSLGYQVRKDTGKAVWAGKRFPGVALFGVPCESAIANKGTSKAPDEIRKQLYRFSLPEGLKGVADLGNLKPGKSGQDIHYALRDVVEYLSDLGIISVIIGGSQDASTGIAAAFSGSRDFTLTVVDSRLDLKSGKEATSSRNFISRILAGDPGLFHLQVIGLQRHLVDPVSLRHLRKETFDYTLLGTLRDDFSEAEPLLRQTAFLSFDIAAVRQADAKSGLPHSPSGLFSEEACRISHYAGLGSRIKAFGLFEVNPSKDPEGVTVNLAGQILWYFLEALVHRIPAVPEEGGEAFLTYHVEIEGQPLIFHKHAHTGRWWIEIPAEGMKSLYIPCSEKDYFLAMKQEIPDVWWKFARKTDRRSK
jgi:arginase family enzyme